MASAALSGRSLVLPKDVGEHQTTMTHGDDVAWAMAMLIGNDKALGEAFHVTGTDHMKWREVAGIYKDVLEEKMGRSIEIYEPETSEGLSGIMGNAAQIKYDRTYDRVFDNTKLLGVCGESFAFINMRDGLKRCLSDYLNFSGSQKIEQHNIRYEAWLDKSTEKKCSLHGLESSKDIMKYFGYYYAPHLMTTLRKTMRTIKKH